MTSQNLFSIPDEWKNYSDPCVDPFYKKLMDEVSAARSEQERALRMFLHDKYLLPETCDTFAAADLRWRNALQALRSYTWNLLQQA